MRFKKPLKTLIFLTAVCIVSALSLLCLSACAEEKNFDGLVKVVYELEGGRYKNCEFLTHYYEFGTDGSNLINEPTSFSEEDIVREGYTLEGWYRKRTEEDGYVSYEGKWDFSKDKVSAEGITLYAHWRKNVKYTYNVCYRDDSGKLQVLGSYSVDEGMPFRDHIKYADKRYGYTALGYRDEDGNVWDDNFRHPGGEEDTAVNVVVEYIEGEFRLVSTASELIRNKAANIYLLNDIDMKGADFGGFGNYGKKFYGNGFKISNFNLIYGAGKSDLVDDKDLNEEGGVLCISLFGNVTGAEIRDVTFEGVTVAVETGLSTTKKIIAAPLCVKMTNTTVENVRFEGTFSLVRLPSSFDRENLAVVTDKAFYLKDNVSVVTDFTAEITNEIN